MTVAFKEATNGVAIDVEIHIRCQKSGISNKLHFKTRHRFPFSLSALSTLLLLQNGWLNIDFVCKHGVGGKQLVAK